MSRAITIKDVALEAGVSPSTVSYALNGKRPISDRARKRVMSVVDKLGYRPSYAAQMMKNSRTMNIGVAVDQFSNPITAKLMEELGKIILQNGYHMILGISGGNSSEGENILKNFASGIVDGVINMLPEVRTIYAKQLCSNVPVVTYGRPNADSPVSIDYQYGMNELLNYLLFLGHKRIGFVTIEKRKSRSTNFEDPCILSAKIFYQSQRIEWNEDLVCSGDGTFDSGIIAGKKLYNKGATAIFSGNDITGAGILAWAHTEGILVPKDLSVAGFDDAPIASSVSPPLTTVQISSDELAKYTFGALKNKIDGYDSWQHKMSLAHLIKRKSCNTINKK